MNPEELLSVYLRLTNDIHSYWAGFGALTILIVGWLLSRKKGIRFVQRIALTVGWFAVSGYLGACLINRYRLVSALSQDVQSIPPNKNVLKVIAELSPIYQHFEAIVWTSFGLISFAAMLLIWSDISIEKASNTTGRDNEG